MVSPRCRQVKSRLVQEHSRTLEHLLYSIARLLRRRFDARTRGLQLSRPQYQALLLLNAHEGINQTGLAQLLDLKPITLVRLIDRLQSRGFIERRTNTSDRRAWLLGLTPAARRKVEQVRELEDATCSEALAGLTPSEIEQVVLTLQVVRSNLLSGQPVPGTTKANEAYRQSVK
jgi:MarR family transcriptional regulator, transcriptional regulator for hemolysin